MTDKREALIEQAIAGLAAFDEYWGDGGPVDAALGRPWELIRGLLAVFEQAHTPTDDEREALKDLIEDHINSTRYGLLTLHDAILAAGFRRPVQGEPATRTAVELEVPGDAPTGVAVQGEPTAEVPDLSTEASRALAKIREASQADLGWVDFGRRVDEILAQHTVAEPVPDTTNTESED